MYAQVWFCRRSADTVIRAGAHCPLIRHPMGATFSPDEGEGLIFVSRWFILHKCPISVVFAQKNNRSPFAVILMSFSKGPTVCWWHLFLYSVEHVMLTCARFLDDAVGFEELF